MQVVILLVGQGITVGVSLKLSQVKYLDYLVALKKLMVGNIFEFSIVQEPGPCLAGQDDIPRVPGKFIAPWIIIVGRCYESAGIGLKNINLTSHFTYPVYDAHGRHMVYAGIHAHFIQQYNPLFPGLCIESPDLLRYIGGRYERFPAFNTVFSKQVMHPGRQHGDHNISSID